MDSLPDITLLKVSLELGLQVHDWWSFLGPQGLLNKGTISACFCLDILVQPNDSSVHRTARLQESTVCFRAAVIPSRTRLQLEVQGLYF